MPTRTVSVPFALGQDESISSVELPNGALRECINVRQRALHSFGMRADFTAQSMAEFGGTLVPYDLYNLNGRLVALGDRQIKGRPTDLFSFVQQPGGAWSGVLPGGSGVNGNTISPVTALRGVGSPGESAGAVGCARVGAVNGIVCLAYGQAVITVGNLTFIHIFRASTDETLVNTSVVLSSARVVVAGNSLWVIGCNASNNLVGYRFDTTTATAISAPVTLIAAVTVQSNVFDACSVMNTAQFAVLVRNATNDLLVRRFNEAGVQQQAIVGPLNPGTAISNVAIEADNTANRIVIAYKPSGDCLVQTYNLTTGASVAGPQAMFGIAMGTGLYLQRMASGISGMMLIEETGGLNVKTCAFPEDSPVSTTIKQINNYSLTGRPSRGAGYIIAPMSTAAGENELVFLQNDFGSALTAPVIPAAVIEGGLAALPGVSDSVEGGDCCIDTTTGKAYWSRLATSTDGKTAPFVAEYLQGSTGRRSSCQQGNALVLAGGLPVHFDGRRSVESGFPERPSFFTNPTATTGGALTPGASYDYVFIWTYQDAINTVAKSKVSDIKSVTLTSVQNAVQMGCFSPHTLRRDNSVLYAPIIEVYRTTASVVTTTGAVISTRDFNASPLTAGDLAAKTLILSINGGGSQTVTFAGTDDTLVEVMAAITAQCTGVTVTAAGGVFVITTNTAGSAGSVTVVGGTTTDPGAANLGVFASQVSTGTSSFSKGTVFQRVNSTNILPSDTLGQSYTILDTMSDVTILSQTPLYTNAERGALSGILEHEAPTPFEFCSAIGKRVFIGGLLDRSELRVSKELFPGETLAFTGDAAFRARVEGDVTAVSVLDGIFPIAFTADNIYVFPSSFADDNGNNGALGPPQKLDAEEGCKSQFSVYASSMGVFYQSRTGKLMLLPSRGAPVWIGRTVQTTLALFPTITGVAYVEVDNCLVFQCQNLAGNASVNLVFDLQIQQWIKDTFAVAQVNKACVDYLGRLAYVDSATVRLQSVSLVPATFIPYSVKTGSLNPFGGDGWGRLPMASVPFQWRGDCQLQLSVSYDDGRTFDPVTKNFPLLSTFPYVADQVDRVQWYPARVKGSSYVLLFEVIANAGTASEGVILQRYTLELEGARPQRARLAAAQKG